MSEQASYRRLLRPTPVFLFLLIGLLAIAAIGAAKPAPIAAKEQMQPRSLRFGMVAVTDAASQYRTLLPFANWLGAQAGLPVEVEIFTDYVSILDAIDHEALDIAILTPVVYALCLDDTSLTYLATEVEVERPFYHSMLISRKDRIQTGVQSLKGARIGFVDRYSASGYLYPAAFLKKAGLIVDGKPQFEAVFLKSHERVLRALVDGSIDAAASFDNFFVYQQNLPGTSVPVSLKDFRLIKLIEERIPNDAVVCRTALGKSIIGRLSAALKEYESARKNPKNGLADLWYKRFDLENRSSYESVARYLPIENR